MLRPTYAMLPRDSRRSCAPLTAAFAVGLANIRTMTEGSTDLVGFLSLSHPCSEINTALILLESRDQPAPVMFHQSILQIVACTLTLCRVCCLLTKERASIHMHVAFYFRTVYASSGCKPLGSRSEPRLMI